MRGGMKQIKCLINQPELFCLFLLYLNPNHYKAPLNVPSCDVTSGHISNYPPSDVTSGGKPRPFVSEQNVW